MNALDLNQDTIVAVSTPHGMGGIAVVRVSGPDALTFVEKRWQGVSLKTMASHTVHLGKIMDAQGELLDEVERLTGIDFFSSLPDATENAVEAQNQFKKWPYHRDREFNDGYNYNNARNRKHTH